MTVNGDVDWRERSLGVQWERILHEAVLAICEAHAEAVQAQYAQGSWASDTYGHTLKVRQHELLNDRLKQVPGIVLRKPEGVRSRFEYPVIEETNTVLVPLRFSSDPTVLHQDLTRIDISGLRRALLAGSTPPEEPSLLDMVSGDDYQERYEEELAAYEQLATAGSAVVVGFCSTREAVFEIGLGDLVVDDAETGLVSWRRWHSLPVYSDLSAAPAAPALRAVADLDIPERFDDDTAADDLALRLRPVAQQAPNPEAREDDEAAELGGNSQS